MLGESAFREAYGRDGHVVMKSTAPLDVAGRMLGLISVNLMQPGLAERFLVRPGRGRPTVNLKPSYEFYGANAPLVLGFHWGLTSRMCELTGKRLAPTYSYFRTYQKEDVCTVHTDRPACEHSMSMSLAYSDDIVWNLDIGTRKCDQAAMARNPLSSDFGDEPFLSVRLDPGDALVYKGIDYRHGRTTPNPNRWSAHVFMHWVDIDGPHADWAFDRRPGAGVIDFSFPEASARPT